MNPSSFEVKYLSNRKLFIINSWIHKAETIILCRELQKICIMNCLSTFVSTDNERIFLILLTETVKNPLAVTENSPKLAVTKRTKKNSSEIVTHHHCSEHHSDEVTESDTLHIQIMLCGKLMWTLKSWVSWQSSLFAFRSSDTLDFHFLKSATRRQPNRWFIVFACLHASVFTFINVSFS